LLIGNVDGVAPCSLAQLPLASLSLWPKLGTTIDGRAFAVMHDGRICVDGALPDLRAVVPRICFGPDERVLFVSETKVFGSRRCSID
jgi:hypothetical protein